MKCSRSLSLRILVPVVLILMPTLTLGSAASAVELTPFDCITDNDAGDCAIGESQLSATIVESGHDALLTIVMTGDDDAVVEQLFIESSVVRHITFLGSTELGTVSFGSGALGGNLPGGNPVGFDEAVNIAALPDAPLNGIGRHPQDDVSAQAGAFLLDLGCSSFEDLLADLRIGVHVIGYASGGSESFTATPVPEPGTAALLAAGLIGLAFAQRRFPTR
jgi:hypothetical protein